MVLGKWYPLDEDGDKTRFAEYYSELVKVGVPFGKENQYNFFKKDEEEKFKRNYTKWLKWYVENVKEEDVEETTKVITEKKVPSKTVVEEPVKKEKPEAVVFNKKSEKKEVALSDVEKVRK